MAKCHAFPISVDECSGASVNHFSGIGDLKIWHWRLYSSSTNWGLAFSHPQFHNISHSYIWKPWPIYFDFSTAQIVSHGRYVPLISHSIPPKNENPHFRRVTSSFPRNIPMIITVFQHFLFSTKSRFPLLNHTHIYIYISGSRTWQHFATGCAPRNGLRRLHLLRAGPFLPRLPTLRPRQERHHELLGVRQRTDVAGLSLWPREAAGGGHGLAWYRYI